MSGKFEKFGKYILLEKLASGGMAEVFLARSSGASGVGKFVAVKRILPQYSESQEFINMFKAEAKVAVNLAHSNIVSIYEFGVESHQFFLVMDYIEGRNMRQFLNRMKKDGHTFSIDQIIYIIKEMAAGLDHAHRCLDGGSGKPLNIIHRDISPQNIMVSFEGEVKVVDFGIAKSESMVENTKTGTLKGKFGYMSPEQAEGASLDLRTDIFSLGIVMWELLANDRLFIANNEVNTLRKIRDCIVPSLKKINPSVSSELEQIVQKALAKDRNLRYQTCAEFHRDLNRYLNRHYPDFTPHDFASFTKSLFSDEIVETRKRLVDYVRDTSDPFSSSITTPDARTEVIPPNAPSPAAAVPQTPAPSEANELINAADLSEHKVDLGHLKIDTSRIAASQSARTGSYHTSSQSVNQRSREGSSRSRKSSSSSPLSALFTLILIGAGTAMLFHTLGLDPVDIIKKEVLHKPASLTAQDAKPLPQGPVQVAVLVVSEPTGAEVFIGNTSTGVITPATIQVEEKKPVTVEGRMDDWVGKTLVESPENGAKVVIKLERKNVGYLEINVPNGEATIYVNNEEIAARPPVKRLPVDAGKVVHVLARSKNGATDEIEIMVSPDQIQPITLNPRLPHQKKSPASQR